MNLVGNVVEDGFGGKDTLRRIQNAIGSSGNDTLIASNENAVLQGSDGNDSLQGGDGDDVLLGGIGADDMDGGGGTNTTTYLESRAAVYVNLSSLNVGVASPINLPINASPFYLAANSGEGGEAEAIASETSKMFRVLSMMMSWLQAIKVPINQQMTITLPAPILMGLMVMTSSTPVLEVMFWMVGRAKTGFPMLSPQAV